MSFVPYDQLRTNFARAIIVGLIGTFVFTFMDVNPMLSMAPPIVTMVLYFLWYRDKSNLESQVEQFADSFYYMGFLFTLGALAISLIPWAIDSATINPEQVISKLGIALLTTIIGLGGRVYLTQFLVSEEEAIADIQKRLRDGSRSLAAELDLIVENFAKVRKTASKQIEKMIEDGGDALRKALDEASDSMSTSLTTFEEGMSGLTSDLQTVSSTISEFQEGVASVSASTDTFKTKLDTTSDIAGKYGEQFEASVEQLNRIGQKLEDHIGNLQSLGEATNTINELAASLERLQTAISRSEQAISRSSNELLQITDVAKSETAQLTKRNERYEMALRDSVKMIDKTKESLAEAVKITTHNIENS